MSYKLPLRKKGKKVEQKLNLIPILDAVFIFIFFLLMSAQFIKIYEISSEIPIVSNAKPPKSKKKPLALTLKITKSKLILKKGIPSKTIKVFKKKSDNSYDLVSLHDYLIQIKKKNLSEKTIVFEPVTNLEYEKIIEIMDSVRMFKNTDETLYKKDKDGLDEKLNELFSNIVFGNLLS